MTSWCCNLFRESVIAVRGLNFQFKAFSREMLRMCGISNLRFLVEKCNAVLMCTVIVLVVNISAGKLEEGRSSTHTLSGWKEFSYKCVVRVIYRHYNYITENFQR